MTVKTMPATRAAIRNRLKNSSAFLLSPSPSVMPTMAEPPVPSMKPMVPISIGSGMMRLTAAKAVLPTKFETHRPSTMP